MPDNEFLNDLRDEMDSGRTDPYISPEMIDAIPDAWDAVVDAGYEDLAAIFSAYDIDSPGDISGVHLSFDGDSWSLELNSETTIDLGDIAPDWVWDELYDFADEYDIDWDVEYGEDQ